ncbi:hypothetical protein F4802DRAFT_574240 [Xylaria palmicola]|nr:hypothetical protein F4802DRAFT_574240 [Xylaria palmicola]
MMPGLSLNTEAAGLRASQQPSVASRGSASAASSGSNPPPTRTFQSTTPIPVPVPPPYASREQQAPQQPQQPQPQPQQPHASPSARSASPARPTYSPITPPLRATAFPPARPRYTHASHADGTAVPVPPPEPVDFDGNPDVLALRSAIAVLQMQRRKAERDMAALDRVKRAALADPDAFVRDLTAGRVRVEGERLFVGGVREGGDSESESESESSGSRSGSDSEGEDNDDEDGPARPAGTDPQPQSQPQPQPQPQPDEIPGTRLNPGDAGTRDPPPWASIPKPQNIVRCPPINWSQYAVVGESLDKLHNEQVLRPAQGAPAVLTPDGRFEFKGGDGGGVGKQERYVGVAAPYAPGKDKLEGKPRAPPKR